MLIGLYRNVSMYQRMCYLKNIELHQITMNLPEIFSVQYKKKSSNCSTRFFSFQLDISTEKRQFNTIHEYITTYKRLNAINKQQK